MSINNNIKQTIKLVLQQYGVTNPGTPPPTNVTSLRKNLTLMTQLKDNGVKDASLNAATYNAAVL